ncbi:hypothetical protein P5757_15735 [Bacillus tropicus]|uniref:hypothetical protein n=1 Tax=Bacillus tropicus TaxID=2026188 RepID=UPI0024055B56|nr:hypothetical protein [Bacillus tropicus]MDF9554140.1 hypothetical protein [Bacillus tropicus]MDF9590228.1 hypothetical protein [Bacillus tropicus]MDF9645461.1 hypothetical protein [Bacillus tropicus]
MPKFGIHSIEQLPDKRKRRRLFSFSDTLGNDKEILVKLLNEKLGDYCPKEVPVPKNIKNVDNFSHKWDLGVFYQSIKEFLGDSLKVENKSNILYVGDIDTFIPFCGHFLVIDEKTSITGLKATQLLSYLTLANLHDITIWCLIGVTQDTKDNLNLNEKYKLCVIKSFGRYELFEGSLEDVLNYFQLWLKECCENPKTSTLPYYEITQQILSDVTNDEQYTNLSFEVEINKHLQQFGNEDDQEKNGNYN